MRPCYWIFLILILAGTSIKAEYRVFELEIENTTTGTIRNIQTTLDHLQYARYHPVRRDEVVRYITSWMCYENTNDFRPYCKKVEPEL